MWPQQGLRDIMIRSVIYPVYTAQTHIICIEEKLFELYFLFIFHLFDSYLILNLRLDITICVI